MSLDSDETLKKNQSAKQKHACKAEKMENERKICEKGIEKMHEVEIEQYNGLCRRFEAGATPHALEEFLEMIDSMCRPFICQIDGHEVSLTQDDCTIMM